MDPRTRNGFLGAALAWGAIALVTSSCTLALGINPDEYTRVVDEICGCENIKFAISDCNARIRDSLDGATEEQRQAWLETYESESCGTCSDGVVSCLQQAPVCRAKGEACSAVLDCCGVLDQDQACVSGHCGSCVQTGGACATSAECCDLFTGNTYCYEGTCRAQAPDCKHTLEPCTVNADCCGFEIAKGGCDSDTGYCYEACANDDAPNCPGCCAHGGALGQAKICIDGPAVAVQLANAAGGQTACDLTCWLGVDETCPEGRTCTDVPVNNGESLQLCLLPP